MSPKTTWYIKLMNTVTKMSEDCLNMLQDSNVIVFSCVSIIILQSKINLGQLKFLNTLSVDLLCCQFHH